MNYPLSDSAIHQAEIFLVKVIKSNSEATNFTDLRKELFHSSKSATHLKLPPTSEGLRPHILRAYYNTQIIVNLLTEDQNHISPLEFGYELQEELMVPTTSWRKIDDKWTITCQCTKCTRITCACRSVGVKCVPFCKCKATNDCKNPMQ